VPSPVEPPIETSRLTLVHISVEEMVTLFEHPGDGSIYPPRGVTNPYRVLIDDPRPLPWRVPQVRANPSHNRWFLRWIVLRESGEIIGSTGFHTPPAATGTVEIGIGMHAEFRRRGYGREAVAGMFDWAARQPEVRTLRYTVSPGNEASVRLINAFRFDHVGQQIDQEDGPEDIYEMSAAAFAQRTVGS